MIFDCKVEALDNIIPGNDDDDDDIEVGVVVDVDDNDLEVIPWKLVHNEDLTWFLLLPKGNERLLIAPEKFLLLHDEDNDDDDADEIFDDLR